MEGLPENRDERRHPTGELRGAGWAAQQVATGEGISGARDPMRLHLKVVVHLGLPPSPDQQSKGAKQG